MPRFTVGQHVTMPAFIDAFGKEVPETPVLTVVKVQLITPLTMDHYYRVLAHGPGLSSYEAHERMFTEA